MIPRLTILGSLFLLSAATSLEAATEATRPNFLVILADDLGFSDLECFGGEIKTPSLNSLASGGLRFTQFYNTTRCWPTRASLLTGYYAQQVGFDALPGEPANPPRKRPRWARLLPEYMRPLGYRSYHAGKWHLDGDPIEGGFDRSYSLNDHNRYFSPREHTLDGRTLPPVQRDAGYYATTAISERAMEFLKEHAKKHGDAPFFAYVAFTSPHFPLHALPKDIVRYTDRYHAGWDAVRQDRWLRIKTMLQLPGELSAWEPGIGPPYAFPRTSEILGPREVYRELAWSELTDEQQAYQAAKMAVHAAMVDRMDQEIGRMLGQLRALGLLDNTVIFFFSDNGASAEIMVRGDGHKSAATPGSSDAFLCLGPGWSRAANTPFRRHKTWVHEGGIATPLIVHWPAKIVAKGELRRAVAHVIDLAPTILQLAGGRWPTEHDGIVLPPAPGRNLSTAFSRDVKIDRPLLWWFHQGNKAIRVDDWKLVAAGNGPWELYDLHRDRAENHDLAGQHPEKVSELQQLWQNTAEEFKKFSRSREP
jgi:arylsulfatase